MDEILKIFGGGSSDEESEGTAGSGFSDGGQGRSFGGGNQSLPGGGGVWEFEMPAGGIQEWQNSQQGSVYNVPAPPANNSPQSLQNYEIEPGLESSGAFAIPGGVPISEIEVKESTIEGYMKTMGLAFEKADSCLWIAKYEGGAKDYDLYVELTSSAVRLVMPVLERVRDVCREKVWYHLLRLNYVTDDITMGVNKRDEIFMSSAIPMRYISYDDFKRAVTYIFTMADEVYPELLFLAQKTTSVSTFLQSEPNQGGAQ